MWAPAATAGTAGASAAAPSRKARSAAPNRWRGRGWVILQSPDQLEQRGALIGMASSRCAGLGVLRIEQVTPDQRQLQALADPPAVAQVERGVRRQGRA